MVAEGVETEQQHDILVEQNCDVHQGWLCSKANSQDEMTKLLDKHFEH